MATKVQGLDRLKAKLRVMPEAAKVEIQGALNKGADDLVEMQKRLTRSDRVSASIAKSPGRHELAVIVSAGGGKAFFARYEEFGTKPHTQGGQFAGTQHPGTAAHPFFFPAYRALRKRIKGRVSRAVTKAARKVAAGGV